jgi:hypothetical protein
MSIIVSRPAHDSHAVPLPSNGRDMYSGRARGYDAAATALRAALGEIWP